MNDFFVLVDHKNKQLLAPASELPNDWMNISGLKYYDEEKLKDLTWAGHNDKGWVRISDASIQAYDHSPEWLAFTKSSILSLVSEERKERETGIVIYKKHTLRINEKTKIALFGKKIAATENAKSSFVWKFDDASVELKSSEIIELANFVENYIQQCFDVEYKFEKSLKSIKKISDLTKISFDLTWPSNTIS